MNQQTTQNIHTKLILVSNTMGSMNALSDIIIIYIWKHDPEQKLNPTEKLQKEASQESEGGIKFSFLCTAMRRF